MPTSARRGMSWLGKRFELEGAGGGSRHQAAAGLANGRGEDGLPEANVRCDAQGLRLSYDRHSRASVEDDDCCAVMGLAAAGAWACWGGAATGALLMSSSFGSGHASPGQQELRCIHRSGCYTAPSQSASSSRSLPACQAPSTQQRPALLRRRSQCHNRTRARHGPSSTDLVCPAITSPSGSDQLTCLAPGPHWAS